MDRKRKGKLYLFTYKKSWEPKEKLPDVSHCEDVYYSRCNRDKVKVEIVDDHDSDTQTGNVVPISEGDYTKRVVSGQLTFSENNISSPVLPVNIASST